jgi:ribosome-associated translation inhibitor RaiA
MNVTVSWNNVSPSRWMENHISHETDKLARHLPEGADVTLRFNEEGITHQTRVHVHAMGKDFFATGEGEGILESLADACITVTRQVAEHNRLTKDKIHRKARRRDKPVHTEVKEAV